jgi:hypothetical protein
MDLFVSAVGAKGWTSSKDIPGSLVENILKTVDRGQPTTLQLLNDEDLGDVLGKAGVTGDPTRNSTYTSGAAKAGTEPTANRDVVRDVGRVGSRADDRGVGLPVRHLLGLEVGVNAVEAAVGRDALPRNLPPGRERLGRRVSPGVVNM